MTGFRMFGLLAIAFVLLASVPSTQLWAKPRVVECDGRYKPIRGIRDLFVNYCEDAYMARVAREFGMNVTADQVHNNKLLKVEICQFIGHDTRLQDMCGGYVPH